MFGLIGSKAKRRILYGLVLLLVFVLQSTRGLLPRPWGSTANLYPFLICIMAFTAGACCRVMDSMVIMLFPPMLCWRHDTTFLLPMQSLPPHRPPLPTHFC